MMSPLRRFLAFLLLASLGGLVEAQSALETQVQHFLQMQPELAGKRFRVEWPRESPRLPSCKTPLGIEFANGVKSQGWSALSVRCTGVWERIVQIRLYAWQRYLVAARNLMPGQSLTAEDLMWVEGERASSGDVVVQDLSVILGQELRRPLAKGAPLYLNSLRPVTVIKQGSKMMLLLRGQGFEIEVEGKALDNAPMGGSVRVMVKEGTIIPAKVTAPGVAEAQ